MSSKKRRIRSGSSRRQHAKVTITDVARAAGVSPMTVSRVVNGENNVRPSTRDAVNASIKRLGYSPNKAARSLASATQIKIGLICINPSSSYLSLLLLGVLEQARQSDTQIVVIEAKDNGTRAVKSLIQGGADGVMLSPPLSDSPRIIQLLENSDMLTVAIGTEHKDRKISTVSIDDYGAAREMTEHIISQGHERIGFITGSQAHMSSNLRLSGYKDALREAGIDVDPELIVQGQYSYRSGLEAAEILLNLRRRPTAIFASNDDMAAATAATAHRYHIEIPDDLTVCGFDDTMLSSVIYPSITTIRQPITDMSHAAIELLEKNIREKRAGLEVETGRVRLDYELIKRQSDSPPPNRRAPQPRAALSGQGLPGDRNDDPG